MNELPGLALIRRRKLLTIRDLAERSGVAKDTVLRLEHGAKARPATTRALAAALGVDPGELVDAVAATHEASVMPETPDRLAVLRQIIDDDEPAFLAWAGAEPVEVDVETAKLLVALHDGLGVEQRALFLLRLDEGEETLAKLTHYARTGQLPS